MKSLRQFGLLALALMTAAAVQTAPSQAATSGASPRVAQRLTVALPPTVPGGLQSRGHVEFQVLSKGCCGVRIEVRCVDSCTAHYSRDLERAEFNGALLLGVHPDTGDIDIATLWGEGTGWTVRVFNVTPTKVRSVLEAHTNTSPEFKVDYIGHDGLAVPDDVDISATPWRYDGATTYEWNGSRFTERRIKRYRPRGWWQDQR